MKWFRSETTAHESVKNIKSLQMNFIITYVDKAPNNYATICKSYNQSLNSIISLDTNFKLFTDSINVKNKQICADHKLLKIPQSSFNYLYLVLIPKFYKSPVKFRTVTVGCNTYSNSASKILLNILKQIYVLTIKTNDTHCHKNSYQLIESLNKIKNVKTLLHMTLLIYSIILM